MQTFQLNETMAHRESNPVRRGIALSPVQRGLWFMHQADEHTSAYNICVARELEGEIDSSALKEAVRQVVERQEALRLRFAQTEDGPVMMAEADVLVPWAVHDFSTDPDADAAISAHLHQLAHERFDLEVGPPLRAVLIFTAAQRAVLGVAVHHIVADGFSTELFFNELLASYGACVSGNMLTPAPLNISFLQHARAQSQRLSSDEVARQERYWTATIRNDAPPVTFPPDAARTRRRSQEGRTLTRTFDSALAARIDDLARREHATPFMVILAAVKVLLHRLNGERVVSVGTPTLGRPNPELMNVIGCFANTLVIQTELAGDLPFTSVLGRVSAQLVGALQNQDVAFDRVVSLVNPERDPAFSPLFQVLVTYHSEKQLSRRKAKPILGARTYNVARDIARYDVSLDLYPHRDGSIRTVIEYTEALYEARSAERIFDQLEQLLRSICDAPHTPVAQLGVSPGYEQRLIENRWHPPAIAPLLGRDPLQLFLDRVSLQPDRRAVGDSSGWISYRTLHEMSETIAVRLTACGIDASSIVALALTRSTELVACLLAILKMGAAYVPLDPDTPAQRLSALLGSVRVDALVCEAESELAFQQFASATGVAPNVACFTKPVGWAPRLKADVAEDLLYVIHTSGTSGTPKAVLIRRAAMANLVLSVMASPGIDQSDVMLCVTPPSFDLGGLDLFLALGAGAAVRIATKTDALDGHRLLGLIESEGVTTMQATPATYQLIRAALADENARRPVLRSAWCGGEAWDAGLAEFLLGFAKQVWNLYGPTETTVWSTAKRVRTPSDITLGHPVANTDVWVLDEHGAVVPIGAVGEIAIGGAGVALGYLHEPSAARFVANPFRADGSRMYRTGDRGRYLADGDIACLGRDDRQIKLRGFRIEPSEIEAAILKDESFAQGVVVARHDVTDGGPCLVAYLVPSVESPAPDPSGLRARLLRCLPRHMVPDHFVFLDALPLSANRKVDLAQLPPPRMSLPSKDNGAASGTGSPAEQVLAQIWCEVLVRQEVRSTDNYFALGGHSLLALVIAQRAKQRGVWITPTDILTTGSLAELAATASPTSVPIERSDEQSGAPALILENHAYRAYFLYSGERAAVQQIVVKLPAVLAERQLEEGLMRLEARAPLLRSVYAMRDGVVGIRPSARGIEQRYAINSCRDDTALKQALAAARAHGLSSAYVREIGLYFAHYVVHQSDGYAVAVLTVDDRILDNRSISLLNALLRSLLGSNDDGVDAIDALTYSEYAALRDERWRSAPERQEREAFWERRASLVSWQYARDVAPTRPARYSGAGKRSYYRLERVSQARIARICARYRCSEGTVICAALISFAARRFAGLAHFLPVRVINDGIEDERAKTLIAPLAYAYYLLVPLRELGDPFAYFHAFCAEWTAALENSRVSNRSIWQHVPVSRDAAFVGNTPICFLHNGSTLRRPRAALLQHEAGLAFAQDYTTSTTNHEWVVSSAFSEAGHLELHLNRYEADIFACDWMHIQTHLLAMLDALEAAPIDAIGRTSFEENLRVRSADRIATS